jgi:valyl-tRNA synthetase
MPFVTEEIWSLLPMGPPLQGAFHQKGPEGQPQVVPQSGEGTEGVGPTGFLSEQSWPRPEDQESAFRPDPSRVAEAEFLLALAARIRSLRSEAKVHPKDPRPVLVEAPASSGLEGLLALQEVKELFAWETRGGGLTPREVPGRPGGTGAEDPLRGCSVQ